MKHTEETITLALFKNENNSGSIVRIDDPRIPEKGTASNCFCIQCKEPLTPKRGNILRWSFAHQKHSDCSNETILHKSAKEIFCAQKELLLPGYVERIRHNFEYKGEIISISLEKWGDIQTRIPTIFSHVELEKRFNLDDGEYIVADAVAYKDGEIYCLVEFVVTHAIDKEKFFKLKKLGIPVLEINLSKGVSLVTKGNTLGWDAGDIKRYLTAERRSLGDSDGKKWAYHPGREILIKSLQEEENDILQRKVNEIDRAEKARQEQQRKELERQESERLIALERYEAARVQQEKQREEARKAYLLEEERKRLEQQKIAERELAERILKETIAAEERRKREAIMAAARQEQLRKDEEERAIRYKALQEFENQGKDKKLLKRKIFHFCSKSLSISITHNGYTINFPAPGTLPYKLELVPTATKNPSNMLACLFDMKGHGKNDVTLEDPSEDFRQYTGDNKFCVTINESDRAQAILNIIETYRRKLKTIHDFNLTSIIRNYPPNGYTLEDMSTQTRRLRPKL